jgi:hypothetical protein
MENNVRFVGFVDGYFQLSSKDKIEDFIDLWKKHGAEVKFDEASNRLHIKCSLSVFETLPLPIKRLLTATQLS